MAARGPRTPLLTAGAAITLSGLVLLDLSAGTSPLRLLVACTAFGVGYGLVNAPITNTAVAGMPGSRAGVAAATTSTARQVGSALGVAVAGAVLASADVSSLVPATHRVWWLVVGCGTVGLATATLTTSSWATGTASRARAWWAGDEGDDERAGQASRRERR